MELFFAKRAPCLCLEEKVIEISFENDYFATAIETATSAAPPIPIQGKNQLMSTVLGGVDGLSYIFNT